MWPLAKDSKHESGQLRWIPKVKTMKGISCSSFRYMYASMTQPGSNRLKKFRNPIKSWSWATVSFLITFLLPLFFSVNFWPHEIFVRSSSLLFYWSIMQIFVTKGCFWNLSESDVARNKRILSFKGTDTRRENIFQKLSSLDNMLNSIKVSGILHKWSSRKEEKLPKRHKLIQRSTNPNKN